MMKSRVQKIVAGVALAAAALFIAPSAAMAVYPPNPAENGVQRSGAVVPGGTVTFNFVPGFFTPGERVTFTLTGEGIGPANLASFFTISSTQPVTKTALGDGSAEITMTLPADARCVYTLTDSGTNPSYPHTRSFDLGNCSSGAGTGLATTGAAGDQMLWAWVAGGALAFVGGGVLVASAVRKQRKLAE